MVRILSGRGPLYQFLPRGPIPAPGTVLEAPAHLPRIAAKTEGFVERQAHLIFGIDQEVHLGAAPLATILHGRLHEHAARPTLPGRWLDVKLVTSAQSSESESVGAVLKTSNPAREPSSPAIKTVSRPRTCSIRSASSPAGSASPLNSYSNSEIACASPTPAIRTVTLPLVIGH
jgi:hypothetical protein